MQVWIEEESTGKEERKERAVKGRNGSRTAKQGLHRRRKPRRDIGMYGKDVE